jgi:hypothetical protein
LAPVETSDKGDALNKDKLPEEDPEKVDEDEGDQDSPKKGGMPRGHHSEVPHPMSFVSGRHVQMPHLAFCGPLPPLDASRFPIGKITCALTLTLCLLSYVELLSRALTELLRT